MSRGAGDGFGDSDVGGNVGVDKSFEFGEGGGVL